MAKTGQKEADPRRRLRWGDQPPGDDVEARDRLLDAAVAAYERFGVARTTADDIAQVAGVHRVTVYRYLGSRDEILALVLLRESEALHRAAAELLDDTTQPFTSRLLDSLEGALDGVASSQWLRLLFDPEVASRTATVAVASQMFVQAAANVLEPHIEAAAANGEIRSDVEPAVISRWLLRIAMQFLVEPVRPEEPSRRFLLETFVLPGIGVPTPAEQ